MFTSFSLIKCLAQCFVSLPSRPFFEFTTFGESLRAPGWFPGRTVPTDVEVDICFPFLGYQQMIQSQFKPGLLGLRAVVVGIMAKSGRGRAYPGLSHTTGHAGPHPAVRFASRKRR